MRYLRLIVLLLLAFHAAHARAAEESLTVDGIPVTIWLSGGGKARPVILFSHGYMGCSTQSRFLTEALAEAGYLVVAPVHRDASCNDAAKTGRRPPAPLFRAEAWNDTTYADRRDDLNAVIRALSADPRFGAEGDWSRLGLMGHSLGGYTVLGLAGAWPGWKRGDIAAVLALSPFMEPYVIHRTLGGIGAPVMFQGGTRDRGITPVVARPGGGYDLSPAPKYYVEFKNAAHFAWADAGRTAQPAIAAYSVAFMNRYLKGGRDADSLLDAPGGADVSDLRRAP